MFTVVQPRTRKATKPTKLFKKKQISIVKCLQFSGIICNTVVFLSHLITQSASGFLCGDNTGTRIGQQDYNSTLIPSKIKFCGFCDKLTSILNTKHFSPITYSNILPKSLTRVHLNLACGVNHMNSYNPNLEKVIWNESTNCKNLVLFYYLNAKQIV